MNSLPNSDCFSSVANCESIYDFVDGSWNPADSYRTLTPEHNTLSVFPSWANHEVLPVIVPSGAFEDSRFTINGWLLEPARRL